jgi:hypothetical protein
VQLEGALAFSERKVKDQLTTIESLQVSANTGDVAMTQQTGHSPCCRKKSVPEGGKDHQSHSMPLSLSGLVRQWHTFWLGCQWHPGMHVDASLCGVLLLLLCAGTSVKLDIRAAGSAGGCSTDT